MHLEPNSINAHTVLLLLALIFAILAAIPVPANPRFGWWPWSWVCYLLAVFFV